VKNWKTTMMDDRDDGPDVAEGLAPESGYASGCSSADELPEITFSKTHLKFLNRQLQQLDAPGAYARPPLLPPPHCLPKKAQVACEGEKRGGWQSFRREEPTPCHVTFQNEKKDFWVW
jgi:hypothetical protein